MNKKGLFFLLVFIMVLCMSLSANADPINLALGADASASDNGWGGGSSKSDLVDGLKSYNDTWAHGLAAPSTASGEFDVILGFGTSVTFNTVIPWWHGGNCAGDDMYVQAWDNATSTWYTVFSTTNALANIGPGDNETPGWYTSYPTALTFDATTSEKLKFTFDNSEIFNRTGLHGWLYEVEVYNNPVPEPATMLLLGSRVPGLAGYGRKKFLRK